MVDTVNMIVVKIAEIEDAIGVLESAILSLANKRQLNSLIVLFQKEIDFLKNEVEALSAAVQEASMTGHLEAADPHTQYLLADGSRSVSGSITVTGTLTANDLTVTSGLDADAIKGKIVDPTAIQDGFVLKYNQTNDQLEYSEDLGVEFSSFSTTLTPTGTTQAVDYSGNNRNQIIDLSSATGDVSVSFSGAENGGIYGLQVIQGATPRNITWPAEVKWPGGTLPVVSTNLGSVDFFQFLFNGTNYLGLFSQSFA